VITRGQEERGSTGGLVDGNRGSLASDLNLNGGAVHNLNTRNGIFQNDGCAFAAINSHGVNLLKE
jgi:hypothetical protein